MEKKLVNREIRKVSNFSTLPVLIFMILQEASRLLISYIIHVLEINGIMPDSSVMVIISYTALYVVGGGIAIFTFYKTRSKSTGLRLRQALCKPQKSIGWILKWYLIIIALVYSASILTQVFKAVLSTVFNFEPYSPSFDFGDGALRTVIMVLALSVYAPLFEEIIFRSAVYRNTEIMGQFFAIIFSGVLFGLWHQNYEQFLYTAVMGCGMAFLVAKTRSIIPTIIFHFIMNTNSLLLLNFLITDDITDPKMLAENLQNPAFVSEVLNKVLILLLVGLIIICIIIAGIVLFIIELVRHRKKKKFMDGVFPIKGFKKLLVFLSAPVTVLTLAMAIIGTVVKFFL